MTEETVKDWNRSTVAELKEELASRNLQTTGLKKELIKRLQDDDVNNGDEINAEDVVNDVINAEGEDEEGDTSLTETTGTNAGGNCEGADMVEEEQAAELAASTEETEKEQEHKEEENAKDEMQEDSEKQEDEDKNKEDEGGTKEETDPTNEDEEEELNMEDMVAVDETHDDDDEAETHLDEEDMELDIEKLLKGDDDEMMVLPPASMNKWVFNSFMERKTNCTLCVSKLSAKNVLCPVMVEWSNRASYFCINHDRSGKGCAMLNYSTEEECMEAKKALQQELGEDITISHPTSKMEKDIKKDITYVFDSTISTRSRLLFIEGVPKDVTIEEMCSVFDESQLIIQLTHEDPTHTWEKHEYVFPEEMQNIFALEFTSTEAVENALKTQKELRGEKLTYKVITELEEDYKRFYARKLREARDRKWDVLENKKKEEIAEFTLTDEERMKLYRNISALYRYKGKILSSTDGTFENKVLAKETIIVKLFETRQKIDGDTIRRLKADLMLPEEERFMTNNTEAQYQKLSSEVKRKMQKQAQDPFSTSKKDNKSSERSRRDSRGDRERRLSKDRHGRPIRELSRNTRPGDRRPSASGRGGGPDRFRSDRSFRGGGRRDIGAGRPGRRDEGRGGNRSVWRSPDRFEQKRRRTDDLGDRERKGGNTGLEVAHTLKGLTEVINHKMSEIERLAGGMKARERALEEAYHTITGSGNSSSSFSMGGGGGSYSSMGLNSGGSNFMSSGSGYSSSSRYSGDMNRSGMGRRNNDVDDRFSRF